MIIQFKVFVAVIIIIVFMFGVIDYIIFPSKKKFLLIAIFLLILITYLILIA